MSAETQELLGEFLVEAGELLDDVDRGLVELERAPQDSQLLNRIFRGFHTIKGGAGFLEAAALVELCHKTENLFDRLRSGKLTLAPEMMDAILAATGEVRRMFGEMGSGAQPTPADPAILEAVSAAMEGRAAAPVAASTPVPAVARPVAAGEVDWQRFYDAVVPSAQTAPAPAVQAPAPAQAAPKSAAPAADSSIRIDTARYDEILNLTGEIGLAKNRVACLRTQLAQGETDGDPLKALDQAVNVLNMLVGDLQNAVTRARMQPVVRVFQKYTRLARDVARQLGKQCELEIDAGSTEVDKTILDALNDPLVHLVRNAVDHGIEKPDEREAAGKPPAARVRLAARQVGDRIEIEISDDGKGMRADVLRAKAVEKGLIGDEAAAALDQAASFALVFLPGFSTKEAVSDMSGRGVGMDVVKTNIQKLRGRIEIQSEPGRGTRFVISLPLTLAIMPVLMFDVSGQRFAVPVSAVQEVLAVDSAAMRDVGGKPVMRLRGETLPFMDLAGPVGRSRSSPCQVALVAHGASGLVALGADTCYGRDEVMLKPVTGVKPRGVAGATIAGDGSLVVVLDLNELLN